MEDLVLEAMCTLMEEQVTVRVLERDKELLREVA
jgi:hypothetical protein